MSPGRLLIAVGLAMAVAVPVVAQSSRAVVAARATGTVGERYDGYLGYVAAPSADLRRAVDAVNIKRRALYSELGARRSVSPQDVGVTAGCELLRRVAVGEAYLLADNRWRRRAATDGPPVPDYCTP
jgi:uncharacterized protein YdbL (DUF1318 family)